MNATDTMDRLEVFFGEATVTEARVYTRLEDSQLPPGCQLKGKIVGPECEFAHTLKVTAPLVDQGPGDALLAQAILPDPCFWTPRQPYEYKVEVELHLRGECLATAQRKLAIRPLGVRARHLLFEGKVWVIRGVCHDEVPVVAAADWRHANAVMSIDRIAADLFDEAARQGVLIVAQAAGSHEELLEQIHRLRRFGAVGVIVVEPHSPPDETLRKAARNVLLAQVCTSNETSPPALWADLVVCDIADTDRLPPWLNDIPVPVIARRRASKQPDLMTARSQCDALQRALAGRGDFAGYIV